MGSYCTSTIKERNNQKTSSKNKACSTKDCDSIRESSFISKSFPTKSLTDNIFEIYKYKQTLSENPNGNVCIVTSTFNDKDYVIKSISKENISKDFINISMSLTHQNIGKIYNIYEDDSKVYMIMDFYEGGELFDRIVTQKEIFTESQVKEIIKKLVIAVNYCHKKGVIHRDIKPENILFESNNLDSIRLIDFGLSIKYNFSLNNKPYELDKNSINGTPYYISPEVLNGEIDFKSDVWSIGIVTYFLISRELPFNSNKNCINEIFNEIETKEPKFPNKKWDNISCECKEFIRKCLLKNRFDRPSAYEINDDVWLNNIDIKEKQDRSFISTSESSNLNLNRNSSTKSSLSDEVTTFSNENIKILIENMINSQKISTNQIINMNNKLYIDYIQSFFEKNKIFTVFNDIDKKRLGYIIKEDIIVFLIKKNISIPINDIDLLFSNQKYITFPEFLYFSKNIHKENNIFETIFHNKAVCYVSLSRFNRIN